MTVTSQQLGTPAQTAPRYLRVASGAFGVIVFPPVSILPINPEQLDESTDVPHKTSEHRPRPVAAAFLSALVPGTGQFLLGQHAKGGTLLGSLIALVVCFWPLRLPRFYFAFMVLCWCCIGLYIYAACSPIWSGHVGSRRASRWWLALVVPTTLVMLWLVGNGGMHAAGFRLFLIPSSSMEPTIHQGDRLIADMNYYTSRAPKDQETILFKRNGTFFIKRVIAGGGETVYGKGGLIYVNGPVLSEPYTQHVGLAPAWMTDFAPIIIPAGEYFVIGDNRDVSLDSRSHGYGFVTSASIVGKPLYIIRSNRTGKTIN